MSGLLRRIKRSRPADAGEPLPEGRAAETQGAASTAETPPAAPGEAPMDASEAPTQVQASTAAAETGREDTTAESPTHVQASTAAAETGRGDTTPSAGEGEPAAGDEPATPAGPAPRRRPWRPFRRRAKELPPATVAPVPVLHADPNVPAGIDPADAPMRPPAGRRGRLRRRLRYLRRARELMLRDLGGLLYEIHRTGGGNVEAHANVVGAKVQRIAGLDAEAHAIEIALAAPRAEAVVFEPGVGGTCATCGELYGSDARFCSNCGTPIGAVPESSAPETGREVVAEPARRAFWRRAVRPAGPAVRDEVAGAATGAGDADAETGGERAAGGDADAATAELRREAAGAEQAADEPRDEPATEADTPTEPRDEPAAETDTPTEPHDEPAAEAGTPADERAAGDAARPDEPRNDAAAPRNPQASGRNGRPEEREAPGPGDPLVSRERS